MFKIGDRVKQTSSLSEGVVVGLSSFCYEVKWDDLADPRLHSLGGGLTLAESASSVKVEKTDEELSKTFHDRRKEMAAVKEELEKRGFVMMIGDTRAVFGEDINFVKVTTLKLSCC